MRIILVSEDETVMINIYPTDPARGEMLCDEHLERLVGRGHIEVALRPEGQHTWGPPKVIGRIEVDG